MVVVHGHTPIYEPEIRWNRINIDTGAYATGRLTCLVLEGDDVASSNKGRKNLRQHECAETSRFAQFQLGSCIGFAIVDLI